MPEHLSVLQLVVVGVCVILTGASKTAMPVAGVVSGTVLAATLSPTVAAGFLVPLLLVGDAIAIARYRQHAQWKLIARLLPGLLVGFALAALAFGVLEASVLARVIGVLILASLALELVRRRSGDQAQRAQGPARLQSAFFGTLAGAGSMAANAGATAMTLYLLAMRVPMLAFMGTSAWFFLLLNLAKVPIVLGLGLVTTESLLIGLAYVPALFAGAGLGVWVFSKMDQGVFSKVAFIVSALAGAWLVAHG